MSRDFHRLLVQHDEKDAYEFPSNFDSSNFEARAKSVQHLIEEAFKETTDFEDSIHNQDASFSIAIIFKDRKSTQQSYKPQPAIRFSNFGNMTNIGHEEAFSAKELSKITEILESQGFIYIPSCALDKPYDGVMSDRPLFRNWRTRYFDWI